MNADVYRGAAGDANRGAASSRMNADAHLGATA